MIHTIDLATYKPIDSLFNERILSGKIKTIYDLIDEASESSCYYCLYRVFKLNESDFAFIKKRILLDLLRYDLKLPYKFKVYIIHCYACIETPYYMNFHYISEEERYNNLLEDLNELITSFRFHSNSDYYNLCLFYSFYKNHLNISPKPLLKQIVKDLSDENYTN